MTLHSTPRLPVAIAASIAGALVAVLAGIPEAALLAAPWLVLSILGMAAGSPGDLKAQIGPRQGRVMVKDNVELVTTIRSTVDGIVKVLPDPAETFLAAHPAASDRDGARPRLVRVHASQPAETVNDFTAHEWGTHHVGLAIVELTTPYGLFRHRGAINDRSPVRVHPTPIQLRELLAPWMVRRVSGTHASKASARGVEYADLRVFGTGDSLRDINWRASARSQDLWVSDRHPDRATDVILFVDSFVESGHDVRNVFGLAVEAAVALAESHLSATDRVGLIEFGGLVRWVSPSTGRIQLQRLTDALLATGLYANAADKELPMMAPGVLPPRSFVVTLTPLLDARFIDALFTMRARGHDVAVVECVSYEPEPGEVASKLWQAERAMLRDRLAEHGVAVVQWRPGDHLDIALAELTRRRRRSVRVGGR